jgi:type II secretory pathway pseudopilin PulG
MIMLPPTAQKRVNRLLHQLQLRAKTIAASEAAPCLLCVGESLLMRRYSERPYPQLAIRTCMSVAYGILRWNSATSTQEKRRAIVSIGIQAIQMVRHIYATLKQRQSNAADAFLWLVQQLLSMPHDLVDKALSHAFLVVSGRKDHFNLIEILISISIIVTFSGLVGVVYPKLLEESKESNALIDIHTIASSLVIYYSRTSKYPLSLDKLTETGELSMVPKDPWDNEYRYIPHVDWPVILRALRTNASPETLQYHADCIAQTVRVLQDLPDRIDPMVVLVAASNGPVVFSLGKRSPIFGSSVTEAGGVSPQKKKQVATLIQEVRAAATGHRQLSEQVDSLKALLTS